MRSVLHVVGMATVALCFLGQRSEARAVLYQSEQAVANFTFASQLGSGIYSVSGRTVQIYRLPFAWEAAAAREDGWGFKITVPVTLGFYNFRLADVLGSEFPNHIDTYSVVPGVELSHLVGPRWLIAAFAETGIAREGSNASNGSVYAGGLNATYAFTPGGYRARYHIALLDAATEYGDRSRDSMLRLTNAVEARHNLGRSLLGEPLDWGAYALGEWYLVRPTPPLSTTGPSMSPLQAEIGVTFGTVRTAHVWKIPVPRVGLGYRFGDRLSVWRIVFGAPF